MYRDHSIELMPSMSHCASSFQWPPVSSVNSFFTRTQAASESSRTPSRSKTTAAISADATQALLRAMRSSRPSIVAFSPAPSAP